MTTPTTPSEWVKEFDEKFNTPAIARMLNYDTDPTVGDDVIAGMKTFIQSLLHHNTEDIIDRCIEAARTELLTDGTNTDEDEVYNQAIDDVVAALYALKPTHKE